MIWGRICIAANPAAGGLKGTGRLERFASLLAERGCRAYIRYTKSSGIAADILDLDDGDDLVVAAGGDGTLHQLANVLRRKGQNRPMAFLPMGTANVFSFEAGLPREDGALADLVAGGRVEEYFPGLGRFTGLDGSPEERIFLLMAGSGWDARVVMSINRRVKKVHGKGAYLLAGLGLLVFKRGKQLTVRADGRKMEGDCLLTAVSRFYGGSFSIVPGADRNRPGLSCALVRKVAPHTIPSLIRCAMKHVPDTSGNVAYFDAERVEVATVGIPIQMDGDPVGHTPAVFERAPQRLRMVVNR